MCDHVVHVAMMYFSKYFSVIVLYMVFLWQCSFLYPSLLLSCIIFTIPRGLFYFYALDVPYGNISLWKKFFPVNFSSHQIKIWTFSQALKSNLSLYFFYFQEFFKIKKLLNIFIPIEYMTEICNIFWLSYSLQQNVFYFEVSFHLAL